MSRAAVVATHPPSPLSRSSTVLSFELASHMSSWRRAIVSHGVVPSCLPVASRSFGHQSHSGRRMVSTVSYRIGLCPNACIRHGQYGTLSHGPLPERMCIHWPARTRGVPRRRRWPHAQHMHLHVRVVLVLPSDMPPCSRRTAHDGMPCMKRPLAVRHASYRAEEW